MCFKADKNKLFPKNEPCLSVTNVGNSCDNEGHIDHSELDVIQPSASGTGLN